MNNIVPQQPSFEAAAPGSAGGEEALLSTKIQRVIDQQKNRGADVVVEELENIVRRSLDFGSKEILDCLKNPKDVLEEWFQENLRRNVQDSLVCACFSPQGLEVFKCMVEELGADIYDTDDGRCSMLPLELEQTTLIQQACYHGNFEIVEYLAQKGGSEIVSEVNPNGWSALEFAIVGHLHQENPESPGQYSEVLRLLGHNFKMSLNNPRTVDHEGSTTFIHQAVEAGDREMTRLILTLGANVNSQNERGDTPLHVAVRYHGELIRLLLENGAVVNSQNKIGDTPLHFAVRHDKEHMELLLDNGADPNMKNDNELTPTLTLLRHKYYGDKNYRQSHLEQLIARGGNIHAEAKGENAVMIAVGANRTLDQVKYLVEKQNVDIHHRSAQGLNALMLAAHQLNIEIVEYLLDKGVTDSVSEKGFNSVTAALDGWLRFGLHKAAPRRDAEVLSIVSLLLERKVSNVNHLTTSGYSALYMAARGSHAKLVELLLKNGASFGGPHGEEILEGPCTYSRLHIVRLLVEHAAVGQILTIPKAQDGAQEPPRKKHRAAFVRMFSALNTV